MDPIAAEIAWACGVRLRDAFSPNLHDSISRRVARTANGNIIDDSVIPRTHGATVVKLAQFAWDAYYAVRAERAAAGLPFDDRAERELLEFKLFDEVKQYPALDDRQSRELTAVLVEETLARAVDYAW